MIGRGCRPVVGVERYFRELDDVLLDLRFNRPEVGVLVLKTQGEAARVLAADEALLTAAKDDWFALEVLHFVKRTLKRLDLTARSMLAVIDQGSCFAGSLFELALAADRSYMLAVDDGPQVTLGVLNMGALPMSNGLSRLQTRFLAGLPPPAADGQAKHPVWINLEYLSAEGYVERSHRLPSPLFSGPGAGRTRWFFYPGFTERTGGLLREPGLPERQAAFDRAGWRARHGIAPGAFAVSLFCYEPAGLHALLGRLAERGDAHLLATPGRATGAVRAALRNGALMPGTGIPVTYLAPCPQTAFDDMLLACDLNAVRGEDSLVRALWAGQPFVWHIYPQDDGAHHAKLDAFLDWLQAPASLRRFHHAWNGIDGADPAVPPLHDSTLGEWRDCVQAARARLLAQDDLVTQLLGFVREKS